MFIVVIAKIKLSEKLVQQFQWIHWCSENDAVYYYYYIKHYKITNHDKITDFIITGY